MCLDCGAGFTCSSAACVVDGASQWVVAVERVALPERNYAGDAWDFPGGLPEPIVKIYVVESGGERQIGSFNGGADRLTATFVNAHTSAVSANLLLAGFVARVFDEDSLANDSVGACRFVPGVADFSGGSVVVSCPFDAATQNSGFTLTYRLERR